MIAEIIAGGPAEEAGLQEGDVIVEFNNERVRESTDLPLLASLAGVDREIPIRCVRNQKLRRGSVTLKAFQSQASLQARRALERSTRASWACRLVISPTRFEKSSSLKASKGQRSYGSRVEALRRELVSDQVM